MKSVRMSLRASRLYSKTLGRDLGEVELGTAYATAFEARHIQDASDDRMFPQIKEAGYVSPAFIVPPSDLL